MIGFGYNAIDERGNSFFDYRTTEAALLFEVGNPALLRELLAFDAIPMWSHHPLLPSAREARLAALRYVTTTGWISRTTICFYSTP